MMVNNENYEAYFIDYLEGNLDENAMGELEAFLNANPALRSELETFTSYIIPSEHVAFNSKHSIYRFKFNETPVNEDSFNDFCIAYNENLLNEARKKELLNFIKKHPELNNDFLLYEKTYLISEKIIFSGKDSLYKPSRNKTLIRNLYVWSAAAAGLILAFSLYSGFIKKEELPVQVVNKQITTSLKESVAVLSEPKNNEHLIRTRRHVKEEQNSTSRNNDNRDEKEKLDFLKPIPAKLVCNNSQDCSAIRKLEEYQTFVSFFEKRMETHIAQYNTYINTELEGKKYFLLTLVETGLQQLNKISDSDVAGLSYKTDSSGKIYTYSVKAGFLEFHRKKKE